MLPREPIWSQKLNLRYSIPFHIFLNFGVTCGSLVFEVQYLDLDFYEMGKIVKNLYLVLKTQFLYQQNAHFILYSLETHNFNITIYKKHG